MGEPPHLRLKGTRSIGSADQPARVLRFAFSQVPAGTHVPDEAWRLDSRDMDPFTPSAMGVGITFNHDMVTSTPDITLGTIGFCIYCGAATNQPGIDKPCADEHVIPKGLGGKLILKEASCLSCANAVGVYEGNLLRNLFHVPRKALSIRSRKHRQPPITISTIVDGEEVMIELPINMHPATLVMPSFYLPQMMSSNDRIYQGVQKIWTYKLNEKGFSGGSGLRNYLSPELDLLKFGQLLTKIAFSYSMSYQSIKAFTLDREPIITDKISPLGVFARTVYARIVYPLEFYRFVGGFSERFECSEHLHRIGHGFITAGGLLFDVVYIWMFANLVLPPTALLLTIRSTTALCQPALNDTSPTLLSQCASTASPLALGLSRDWHTLPSPPTEARW